MFSLVVAIAVLLCVADIRSGPLPARLMAVCCPT